MIKTWKERMTDAGFAIDYEVDCNPHQQAEINELRAALVERMPLSESLIGEFYMGVAGAQPTLLTRQLFTGIVKAVEQAHNIKGN